MVDVEEFRDTFRRAEIGPRYHGVVHFALTNVGALAGIGVALSFIHNLRALELVTVPATFVFANLVEYLVHRFLMHVPRRGLSFLHRRHTLMHHAFFQPGAMSVSSVRDWKATLFPVPLVFFFFGGIAAPSALVLSLVAPPNVAALFLATAVGYYLLYEWCHLTWHQPDDSMAGRLPFVSRLRALHRGHHTTMTSSFNVTFPISDVIFHTLSK